MKYKRINVEEDSLPCFTSYSGELGDDGKTISLATELVHLLIEKKLTVSTAESLTGGLMGAYITSVSGSSAIYSGGVVSYTNEVKMSVLGVDRQTVDKYTEVSFECAYEMARGVKDLMGSNIGISFTGYAGPTGGNEHDPVGTVYAGIVYAHEAAVYRLSFTNEVSRAGVRLGTVYFMLESLIKMLRAES